MAKDPKSAPDTKAEIITIKRSTIQILPCGTPPVFSAREQITWNGGSIALAAFGDSRKTSVDALDKQIEELCDILAVSKA